MNFWRRLFGKKTPEAPFEPKPVEPKPVAPKPAPAASKREAAAPKKPAPPAVAKKPASSGSSPLRPGRMHTTDLVKGQNSTIPAVAGVYRHVNKATGKIEYVGQTDNLRVRQQQHLRDGKFDPETQWVQYALAKDGITKDDLCKAEVQHIARHQPSGNKTRGGNGRR